MKKIIILVSLTLFFLAGLGVCSQEPSPPVTQGQMQPKKLNSESNTKSNIEAKSNNYESKNPAPVINKNDPQNSKTAPKNTYKENSNSQSGAVKDDPIATYTLWLVIFTGLLVVCNAALWLYTKKSADAAKKAANAMPEVERAYLFVEIPASADREPIIPTSGVNDFIEGDTETDITVQIWNRGKTLAILTNIHADYGIVVEYPKPIQEVTESKIPLGGVVIASAKWKNIPVTTHIKDKEWEEIRNGNMRLICHGRIDYLDIWKDSHYTRFCWEWSPHQSHQCFIVSNVAKLNDYT
jgi:hypothetical protein